MCTFYSMPVACRVTFMSSTDFKNSEINKSYERRRKTWRKNHVKIQILPVGEYCSTKFNLVL